MMRARRRLLPVVVPVMAIGLVSGCWGGDPGDPGEDPRNGPSSSGTGEPEGPSPDELSQEVLAAADAKTSGVPIGSATGGVSGGGTLTIEVLSAARIDEATLVEMRMTSDEVLLVNPFDFATTRRPAQNFMPALALEDTAVTKTRYLPLQFEDFREACVCPYIPMRVGPEPQIVTAIYPALPPEVTTVTLRAGTTDIVVPNLPVEG